jgi:hypothetical protein
MQHKISLARAVYSRSKTVLIDDIFHTLGKLSSTFIYENCIRGELMKDRTVIVATTWPDMFWARDARLFIHLIKSSFSANGGENLFEENYNNIAEGRIDATETDPEKIVALIKKRRKSTTKPVIEQDQQHQTQLGDVIDTLFDNNPPASNHTLFDDGADLFDGNSVIPDSIIRAEQEEDEPVYKTRDYAYATYYAACGGWKYWISAVLFTLLARLVNISESYWLKEGKPPIFPFTILLLCMR